MIIFLFFSIFFISNPRNAFRLLAFFPLRPMGLKTVFPEEGWTPLLWSRVRSSRRGPVCLPFSKSGKSPSLKPSASATYNTWPDIFAWASLVMLASFILISISNQTTLEFMSRAVISPVLALTCSSSIPLGKTSQKTSKWQYTIGGALKLITHILCQSE